MNECCCKKQNDKLNYYQVIGYAKSIYSGIDFKKKEMYTYVSNDDSKTLMKAVGISYCPFCGRKL